jgi:hypothetical protein
MPRTYEPIASQTLSSTASSVTFSNIPGTYTDLVVVLAFIDSARFVNIRFNSDSSSNYSRTALRGNGSTASSFRGSSLTELYGEAYAVGDPFGNCVVQVMSYANTNVFKTVLIADANASQNVQRTVGLWRSTSAIDTVAIIGSGANTLQSGTVLSLYGIKAA